MEETPQQASYTPEQRLLVAGYRSREPHFKLNSIFSIYAQEIYTTNDLTGATGDHLSQQLRTHCIQQELSEPAQVHAHEVEQPLLAQAPEQATLEEWRIVLVTE